jgi:hypothetical protein
MVAITFLAKIRARAFEDLDIIAKKENSLRRIEYASNFIGYYDFSTKHIYLMVLFIEALHFVLYRAFWINVFFLLVTPILVFRQEVSTKNLS